MNNTERLNLYYWPNIIITLKMNEMGVEITMNWEKKRHVNP
jgi:hypothetical protein